MSKKTGIVAAVLGMCALSLFLASCGSTSNRPVGLLYVLSQAQNNVSSYSINLNTGELSLTDLNFANTCPTAPCGLPINISIDPTGATAFVLNQTSISGYTVNVDGSLSQPTTVWPPNLASAPPGALLASTDDAAGAFMFVVSPGVLPSAVDCSNQIVSDPNCPVIYVFSTTPGSTSVTLASRYFLNRVPTGLSVIATPSGSAPELLFMTSNLDLTSAHSDNQLSAFAVDSAGNLTEQPNSPYITQVNPTVVKAVNTNPVGQTTGGTFVYVGSQNGTAPGSVSEFQLCTQVTSGTVSCTQPDVINNLLISEGTATMAACQDPVATQVDPTNSFLYVLCHGSSNVYGFHMLTGTGALTALNPASVPTGSGPVSLAMHPNYNAGAEFLYTSNNGGNSITGFNVAVTTGTLSSPSTVLFFPGEPSGIAGR
jgi:6-phosphogluconolactonase (cycloisomerase 2 family)